MARINEALFKNVFIGLGVWISNTIECPKYETVGHISPGKTAIAGVLSQRRLITC